MNDKECTFCGHEAVINKNDKRLKHSEKELQGRAICVMCYDAGISEAGYLGEYVRDMMSAQQMIINDMEGRRAGVTTENEELKTQLKEAMELLDVAHSCYKEDSESDIKWQTTYEKLLNNKQEKTDA